MPQQRKKEESEKLREEGGQIRFTDLRFERWQVVEFRKEERKKKARRSINCMFLG